MSQGTHLHPQHRLQQRSELDPVARTEDLLFLAYVPIPGVFERGGEDVVFEGGGEIHGAVVDQEVDLQLGAAGDLVVGAVQVVERQPDPPKPSGGGELAVGSTVAGDMHEVTLLMPA